MVSIYCLYDKYINQSLLLPLIGDISVRRSLDREKVPEYHLQVTAHDGPGLSCVMDIYITLTDVNDHAPTFTHGIYHVSVLENAAVNTLLTRVHAEDYDLGQYVYIIDCDWSLVSDY